MSRLLPKAALLLLSGYTSIFMPVAAQHEGQYDRLLQKAPDFSFNIATHKDSIRTSYLNLGLFTCTDRMTGVSINAFSSVVQSDLYGLQISGLANATKHHANGIQLSGIVNLAGADANGYMLGGLLNVTGERSCGLQTAGLMNIIGFRQSGAAIAGLMNIVGHRQNGAMLSGLTNIVGKELNGVAIAPLANIVGKDVNGVQLSAIMNICGRQTRGAQLSAIGNVGMEVKGVQLAPISNVVAKTITGVQLCGAANIAVTARRAIQCSGLTNVCQGSMKGIQLAPGNYAGCLHGAQIGLLNLCSGEVKGVQIGIINHSKDSTAHKIGLVNITPSTNTQMLLFGGNASKTNLAVRFKNRLTYTMMGFGTHYLDLNRKFSGSVFYRAGIFRNLSPRLTLSGDLGYCHIENFENEDIDTPERMYAIQARLNLEYLLRERCHVFVSGGYGVTRYYNHDRSYEKKPIIEAGIALF